MKLSFNPSKLFSPGAHKYKNFVAKINQKNVFKLIQTIRSLDRFILIDIWYYKMNVMDMSTSFCQFVRFLLFSGGGGGTHVTSALDLYIKEIFLFKHLTDRLW